MEQLIFISLIMSCLMLIIFVHRKYRGARFSRKLYYFIWFIISIRLIFPLDISIDKPIYSITSTIEEYGNRYNEANGEVLVIRGNGTNIIKSVRANLWKIWITGAILYFSYNLLIYISFKSKIKKNLSNVNQEIYNKFYNLKSEIISHEKIAIKESSIIGSPMILGIISPMLIIPKTINIEDLEFIFRHELIHFKRKDITYKLVTFFATMIHWFNPIVHMMGEIAREDLELSCDEEVVRGMCKEYKLRYSKVLVESALESRNLTCVANFSSWGKTMKKRLDVILDDINKKSGKPLIIISIILILSVSMFFNYEVRNFVEVIETQTFVASDFIKPKLEYKDNKYEGYLYEVNREMRNFRWYVTYQGMVE